MRKALTSSILLLALYSSVYAGNIPGDSPTPPPPAYGGDMPNMPPTPAYGGNIPNDSPQDGKASADVIAEGALAVLGSVLAIL